MQDTALFKIALVSSIVGIIVLLFMSERISPEGTSAGEIKEGDYVKVGGNVVNLRKSPGLVSFDLQQKKDKIKVVVFGDAELENNNFVEVEGEAVAYKGELEVKADAVRVV